jgi:hypothetical protein
MNKWKIVQLPTKDNSMMNMSSYTIVYLAKEAAINGPKDGFCRVMSNYFWVVHPENGLVFAKFRGDHGLGSPQCNTNKSLADRFVNSYPGCTVEFYERVFVPVNLRDFE